MPLTPATLRIDLKCGNGAISPGEKCTKGNATKAGAAGEKPRPSITRSALRAAKGFAEFVGPDLAAELLVGGGALILGKGLPMRRKSRIYRNASRTVGRAARRARYGKPRRPRRDTTDLTPGKS